jgi:four helix bundle protein
VGYEPLEDKRMYRRAEQLSDAVWDTVSCWEAFAQRTVGAQFVRAVDSIGANIAEAGGRFHPADVRNFLYYARGSLRETKFWLRRARQRRLIADDKSAELDAELEQLAREINSAISYQRTRSNTGR